MMIHLRIAVLLIISALFLSSCSTPKTPRPPSTYLLNTERSQVQLMNELQEMLIANKYKIKNFNSQTGFIVTQPRLFGVKRSDGTSLRTRQSLAIRQEGGSVTVRATYECEYSEKGQSAEFKTCHNEDVEVGQKIRRIEAILVKQIRKKLEEASTGPIEKDLTVEPTPTSPTSPPPAQTN